MRELSSSDRHVLLALARAAMASNLDRNIKMPELPAGLVDLRAGCFVTLRKKGCLRGCIGTFSGNTLLSDNICRMACAAAFEDPRFSPVSRNELGEIRIELSILTPFRAVGSIDQICVGTHGIYVRYGAFSGTYLPEVAVEQGWNRLEFFRSCAIEKAGIPEENLRDTEIFVYETVKIRED